MPGFALAIFVSLIKLNATLTLEMYREAIESCANHGWIGGPIYDALHLSCARNAACDRIYTLNVRHFQQLAPDLADRIGAPSSFL